APTEAAAPGADPEAAAPAAPAASAGPEGWVFPFDRPLEPGEGDNQALAANTTDGTVQYDVALAMVWVRDGEDALNTNEAFAFASCNTCASVAVAFQVVMVIGDNDVAVPQNLAGAVNYDCVNCLSYALARQLFITLDGPLSEEAMRQLDDIWEQIQAFGAGITGVPLDDLDDRLDDFEAQILAVIETDQPGTVPKPSATASPSASPTASPSTSSSASSSASATATATPSGSASASASPTARPGASPTARPSASPTASSSPSPRSSDTPQPSQSPAATQGSPAPSAAPSEASSASSGSADPGTAEADVTDGISPTP
ncbi:MAG: hypothetical protein WBQ50_04365, partial [Nocardioides sp.]